MRKAGGGAVGFWSDTIAGGGAVGFWPDTKRGGGGGAGASRMCWRGVLRS